MHSTVIISSLLGLAAAAPRAILEDTINKRLNGQTVTVTRHTIGDMQYSG